MSSSDAADHSYGRPANGDSTEPVRFINVNASISTFENKRSLNFFKGQVLKEGNSLKATAGFSRQGRPVVMRFFPGRSDKKALVIGGVHGTELSAIEVAKQLIERLQKSTDTLEYSVLVIPELFPDNAAAARMDPASIGSAANLGRYSSPTSADPNRQMPGLGKAYDENDPVDAMGRLIEPENQMLLAIIKDYVPDRIVNLHAIRDQKFAGVFADPRTDENLIARGFAEDSVLAVNMSKHIAENTGIRLPGNRLESSPNALYLHDPAIAPAGSYQKRNMAGSCLTGGRGKGISLGGWAATAVNDHSHTEVSRPAITLITMEFPGCKRPVDYIRPADRASATNLIDAFASSIQFVFLSRQ